MQGGRQITWQWRATSIKLRASSFARELYLQLDESCRVPVALDFNKAQTRDRA